MAAIQFVLKFPLLKYLEMEIGDNLLVYKTSWDWASNRLNLPILGITEVLGTVHMLSNSDLYPNVRVQISAKLSPSAILRRRAANGNLMHLKSVSPFSMVYISRSWLICWLASKGFADALWEWDYLFTFSSTTWRILDDRFGALGGFEDCLERLFAFRAVVKGVQICCFFNPVYFQD